MRRISFENGDYFGKPILGEMRLCSRFMEKFSDRVLGNKVCRSSATTSRSRSSVFPKMAASPSAMRLQIGNGCRSVGTFTSEVMSIPRRRPWPIGVGLSCIFEGVLAARFHKLVVVVEVAGERQVFFS